MSTSNRDHLFDNLKGLLIFCVVLGHLIQFPRGKTDPWIGHLYTAIYLFHMPLFVFISGYFSKRLRFKRTMELFFVYSLWQVVISPILLSFGTGQTYSDVATSVFSPTNHHWYLFSLVTWRLLLPLVTRIKGVFWWSCLIGLLFGLCPMLEMWSPASADQSFLSISRTLGFFPFFLWGYSFTPDHVQYLRQRLHPLLAGALFLLFVMGGWWSLQQHVDVFIKPSMINKILFMREGYAAFLNNPLWGVGLRGSLYLLQFALILCALGACPAILTKWARFGKHSFFIFLSHYPLILILRVLYFNRQASFNAWHVFIGSFIASLLYCQLCCTKPILSLAHRLTTFPAFKSNKESSKPQTQTVS